jgi:hypothetical protein
MEAQISLGTWALLLIPMLCVVLLSAVSLLRNRGAADRANSEAPSASKTSEGAGAP